ncbi:MAG TPA: hypothetical protein ENO23_02660 [Alphaproteobacteria bacterium]|nr:hypothetical protein [Alphaproteobacteria bacterium]
MRRTPGWTIILFLAAAAAAGDAPVLRGAGRALVAVEANGRLGDGDGGLRWPGADGREHFGGVATLVRYIDGEGRRVELGADRLRPVGAPPADRALGEGCPGGKRFPDRGRDDDGDGEVDEDPLNCIDDDGDGFIDEDFAAIGHDMIVARAGDAASGLVQTLSAYSWSFGHVRDFIGFTSTIENAADAGGAAPAMLEFVLDVDLRLGDAGDTARGLDDLTRHLRFEAAGPAGSVQVDLVSVSDDGGYVAVLALDAAGPGGAALGATAFAAPRLRARELLRAEPGSRLRRERQRGETRVLEAADRAPTGRIRPNGDCDERDLADGESVVMLALDPVPSLPRGEAVRLDWAIVFGETRDALLRNAARAVETYRGTIGAKGRAHRWIVPARQAARVEIAPELAKIWTRGYTRPAVSIPLPESLAGEEIEWLGVNGDRTVSWERVGRKIIVPVDDAAVPPGEAFTVEGQLSDGTLVTSRVDGGLLEEAGREDISPDRLPDEWLRLWPNPFRANLNIDFEVGEEAADAARARRDGGGPGVSSVRIYDVRGRLVRAILDEEYLHPGGYSRGWDGRDEAGAPVAPGVYYCTFRLGDRSLTKRVILLR